MLETGCSLRKIQFSGVNNSIIMWIRNAKYSDYCFINEHKHIYGDFHMHYCTFIGHKGKRLDVQ